MSTRRAVTVFALAIVAAASITSVLGADQPTHRKLSPVPFTEVKVGMSVAVETPSLSDVTLTGVVSDVEFLFQRRRKKDTERGLYSSHEELGETVFFVRIEVDEQQGVKLKPGAVAEVVFPFGR